jgi:hypothetical protein
MQNIDVNQAKQQLPQLIEQAVGGNEVIITGLIEMSDDFDEPLEDFRDYM